MPCGYLFILFPGSDVQIETWEDEEDDYLATLVSQNMCLNSEQVGYLSQNNLVFSKSEKLVNWSDVFVRSNTRYGVRYASKESLLKITDTSIATCVKCS